MIGRKVTVLALVVVMTGLAVVALLVPGHDGDGLWPLLVLPLLVAGLGGGGVVSPNFTLTLADVPPRMGGAAGGALQTGQRIGSALGAALMMSAYQVTLARTDDTAPALRGGARDRPGHHDRCAGARRAGPAPGRRPRAHPTLKPVAPSGSTVCSSRL